MDDQTLDLPLDGLHRAGIADHHLYSDTVSGKDTKRKGLAACLASRASHASFTRWSKLVFHIFAALAKFERNLIRERTQAGLAAARGRAGGRKPKLDTQQIREIKRLMSDPTIPVNQIAQRYKVLRTTIYKEAPLCAVPASEPQSDASGEKSPRQDAA